MKQKIRFEKNIKNGILTVLESSEVDPGVVMPLHEEEYSLEEMTAAHNTGRDAFIALLRRRSLFPTRDMSEKLFDETKDFFADANMEKVIVDYNDTEAFPGEEDFRLEDDDVELDALLEEDGDTKEDEIKEIDSDDDTPSFTPEDTSEHEN
ncbi:MAG TPA: hypothetical protein DHV36_04490 [Desulfobacteraceae bacterium]|nr:hypothetical protein [Desulfobacteraceae bacterium]|tara:strand:- start:199 stop:651 length:453 start_codon:yes stop_codon:yes gene_type:complete